MAAQRSAALPPSAAAAGRPPCGELRVQLFLSLPALDATSCVRARLCFGSGSGVADSCVSVERFAGAVVILPLHAGGPAVQEWLAARAVSLSFESGSAAIGEARLSGLDVCAPAAVRYPVFGPGATTSAPLGHVDVTLRLQLWAGGDDPPEPAFTAQSLPLAPSAAHRTEAPSVRAAAHALGARSREHSAAVVASSLATPKSQPTDTEQGGLVPALQSGSRAELKHASVLRAEAAGFARAPSGIAPAPVDLVRPAPPYTQQPAPPLPYAANANPVLAPNMPRPPTVSPQVRPGHAGVWAVCTPCFLVADALDYLAVSLSSDEEDCRGGRRQLATLLLTASVLCSPNANEAWSLGTPGDWAVELRPARYAFALWIVLYAGIALFALFQALPAQQLNPLLRKSGWHAARALVAFSAWAAFACAESAQRGMPPSYLAKCGRAAVSAGVACSLLLTLTFYVRAVLAIGEHAAPFSFPEHIFVVAPLSLLAGWLVPLATGNTLTAATAVLALMGFSAPPVRGPLAALAVAATGSGAALVVMRAHGNPWLAFSVAWGLCAVAWNNTERGVHRAELHDPGAPLTRDDDVVFAAAVSAGVVLAAAAVYSGFAAKRKWGPRRGMLGACDGGMRSLRSWARSQSL